VVAGRSAALNCCAVEGAGEAHRPGTGLRRGRDGVARGALGGARIRWPTT
jgi:hypothetical protein